MAHTGITERARLNCSKHSFVLSATCYAVEWMLSRYDGFALSTNSTWCRWPFRWSPASDRSAPSKLSSPTTQRCQHGHLVDYSGQSWSSPRWQPESKSPWRKGKANKGVVLFPRAHYKAHKNFDGASHAAPSYLPWEFCFGWGSKWKLCTYFLLELAKWAGFEGCCRSLEIVHGMLTLLKIVHCSSIFRWFYQGPLASSAHPAHESKAKQILQHVWQMWSYPAVPWSMYCCSILASRFCSFFSLAQ